MRVVSAESLEQESIRQRGSLIALVGTTTRVLDDCRLSNGALVEAPSHLPSYPATARDGYRVRPGRELALAILAMDGLGRDLRPILLQWLFEHANSFREDGVLRFAYGPNGAVLESGSDVIGMILLHAAISKSPETDIAKRAIDQLEFGLKFFSESVNGIELKASSAPEGGILAWLTGLPNFDWINDAASVWKYFLSVAAEAESGYGTTARLRFLNAIELADMDGHFSESTDKSTPTDSPTPYLLSHLCFLLAAKHTGELDLIPKSGYTGRRRF